MSKAPCSVGGGGMFSPSRTAINCQPWNNGLTVGIGNI